MNKRQIVKRNALDRLTNTYLECVKCNLRASAFSCTDAALAVNSDDVLGASKVYNDDFLPSEAKYVLKKYFKFEGRKKGGTHGKTLS